MTSRFITAIVAGAGIAALSLPAMAGDIAPPEALTTAYVVHKLASDGLEVRDIEFENGIYVADIATGDGHTYRAAVDPLTATANPHAFANRALGRDEAPAGSLSSSIIVQLLDAAGYPQIAEMEIENGLWKVKARDAAGQKAKLRVDPISGAIAGPAGMIASK